MNRKKRGHGYVIATTVFTLMMIVCIAGCNNETEAGKGASPTETVKAFVMEASLGDCQVAYDLLCNSSRESITLEDFQEIFRVADGTELNIEIVDESTTSDTALVTLRINGSDLMYFPLTREDGEWKLSIDESITELQKGPENAACSDQLRAIDAAIMWYLRSVGEPPKDIQALIPKYLHEYPDRKSVV